MNGKSPQRAAQKRLAASLAVVLVAVVAVVVAMACGAATAQPGAPFDAALERDLELAQPDGSAVERLDLTAALQALHIPSVSVALIEGGRLAWSRAFGTASPDTLYQAASLSKLVSAVAALRLVQQGVLDLDRDVNADLVGWHLPDNDLTRGHPVTLRGLLSMTAGIGVPGYLGYAPGTPLPTLTQILDGAPPANSPPVRVEAVPGSRYAYSGGGYEIVQALIESRTGRPYHDAVADLLFRPAGMANSFFQQPAPADVARRAAKGHDRAGNELPGGWRVMPELAAGGLWSSADDLARLLVALGLACRGAPHAILNKTLAEAMITRQNGGPYGLGGAVDGTGADRVLMKRGQNIGYQAYMLLFPAAGQGMVVLTGSDNGTTLATALIRRAAAIYHWPPLGELAD